MNPTDDNELLSAYLDGEVTADEQARVERRLAEDVGYRQLHDELRALRQHLESLPMARLPADFSQTVLYEAERQMVAPRRSGVNLEPAVEAHDSTDGRRWVRPLLWSGMIAAAGLMVMIFSPAQRESSTAKVARTDAPQAPADARPAAKAPAVKAEPSFEAAASSSIHSDDSLVAAPAAPPAELGKQLENRALKMDQQRTGEGAVQAAKDSPAQLRAEGEGERGADKRDEGSRRLSAGGVSPGDSADRDNGKDAERYRVSGALKKEAQKLSEVPRPAASAPRLADENAPQSSPPFGLGGTSAPLPPPGVVPAEPAPMAPGRFAAKTAGSEIAPPASPATATTPQDGAFGGLGQSGQGPARSAFDAAKTGPRGRGGEDIKRIETAQKEVSQKEISPSLNISVTLTGQAGNQEDFEQLLTSVQQEKQPAGKPQTEQANAPSPQVAVADALNEAGGKRENGNAASQPQQVYEVELTHGALVDLLAQLRSRPAKYRLDPVSEPLNQQVKRRADELVIKRQQEQTKGLLQEKAEAKLADGKIAPGSARGQGSDRVQEAVQERADTKLAEGKSKEAQEKDRAEKTPEKKAEKSVLKSAVKAADNAAAPPAPQLYRVRIVLRRTAADSDPAAAGQAPAPANTPAP
ncbi:MAG: hypothetical protein K8T91_23355 [Planctomycetes bacterium]|nr:hypothetical protein [Planctomycetota bacterium]